jgi:hypothetical protein
MNEVAPILADPRLTEHVAAIHELSKRVIADVIDIGRRLVECKKIVGHGCWLDWLDTEFGWSESTALNFMRVYEMSKSATRYGFEQSTLPLAALYKLAAPSTPETVRVEIADRAKTEDISLKDVKKAIADAKANETPNDDAAESAEKCKRAYADTEEAEEEETPQGSCPVEEEVPVEEEGPPTFRSQCFDAVLDIEDMVGAIKDANAPVLAQSLKLLADAERMLEPAPEGALAERADVFCVASKTHCGISQRTRRSCNSFLSCFSMLSPSWWGAHERAPRPDRTTAEEAAVDAVTRSGRRGAERRAHDRLDAERRGA